MKIVLHLKEDRAVFIKDEFPNAIINEVDQDGFIKVEIEINNNWDALLLFHAGIHCSTGCRVVHNF